MANWVIKSADEYLSLIYDRLHERIYDSKVIHADETPVKVMRIEHSKIKNGKKTYMWVYRNRPLRGTHPIVLFDWQPSRHSAKGLLAWTQQPATLRSRRSFASLL